MTELVLHTAKRVSHIDWRDVPARYVGKASAVCRTLAECADLVKWFGDETFCPYLPVLIKAPGGWTAIAGMGYADAAELRDCAVTLWGRQTEAIASHGGIMDFDALREKHGLMRREDVKAAMSDALTRRIAAHRASPVTDPFRQPQYVRVNGKTVHTVKKIEEQP